MTIIVWLAIGALIGAAASIVHRDTGIVRWAINAGAGMAGALAGGIAEGRGTVPASPWEATGLIVAAASAVILVGIVHLFSRRAHH